MHVFVITGLNWSNKQLFPRNVTWNMINIWVGIISQMSHWRAGKRNQLTSTPRRVLPLPYCYCKVFQFYTFNDLPFVKSGEPLKIISLPCHNYLIVNCNKNKTRMRLSLVYLSTGCFLGGLLAGSFRLQVTIKLTMSDTENIYFPSHPYVGKCKKYFK